MSHVNLTFPTYQTSPKAVTSLRIGFAVFIYLFYTPFLSQGSEAVNNIIKGKFTGSEIIPLAMFAIVFAVLYRISYRASLKLLEPRVFDFYLKAAFGKMKAEIGKDQLKKRPFTFDQFIKGQIIVVGIGILLLLLEQSGDLLMVIQQPFRLESWNMFIGLLLTIIFSIKSERNQETKP